MSRTLRMRPFTSSITIHANENIVNGSSMFDVNGTLTVRCSSAWDRQGPPRPPVRFIVKPINEGFGFWNPDGDEKTFTVGSDSKTWSDLSEGRYHLQFQVSDHAPAELQIEVFVS
jgi:hypothetical protein